MDVAVAAAGSEATQTLALVIAVAGLALALVSLVWQIASFALSGGRVKAFLKLGALHGSGGLLYQSVAKGQQPDWKLINDQGGTAPVIAVEVRNVGRLPVTVNSVVLIEAASQMSYVAHGYPAGPKLPHRMEAGTSTIWAIDMQQALIMSKLAVEGFRKPKAAVSISGAVRLGNGREVRTAGPGWRPLA